jgi:hypothetical protein
MTKEECIGSIGAWYQIDNDVFEKCIPLLDEYTQPFTDRIGQLETQNAKLKEAIDLAISYINVGGV